MSNNRQVLAIGLATANEATPNSTPSYLDAWYPLVIDLSALKNPESVTESLERICGIRKSAVVSLTDADFADLQTQCGPFELPHIPAEYGRRKRVLSFMREDVALGNDPLTDVPFAFLKLHLLSMRMALPNSQNLDNLFGVLHNLAWTTQGPMTPDEVSRLRLTQNVWVHSLDKFPPMLQYVIPSGVRIADSARVRLGAYLGEGTTVMHAGAVNFNSGTLGTSMVEGRVSQGLIIGVGSDIGGGASTMGTLSGGNTEKLSVGERCLIGANGGIGISLGDDCIVEAGLYITGGTPVCVQKTDGTEVMKKGRELSGQNGMLLLRDGKTGRVLCRANPKSVHLNPELHRHN